MSNDFYVYEFAYSDGTVFYVGKGSGDRIQSHLYDARSKRPNVSRVALTIRAIWQRGEKVIIRKVYNNISDQEATDLETEVIERYGYEHLVNSPWAKHRHLVTRVKIGRATFPIDSKKLNDALKETDERIKRDGAIIL